MLRLLAALLAAVSGASAALAWRRAGAFVPLAEGDAPGQVGVVIPARDEAPVIGASVRAWLTQSHPPAQLTVVDDHSSDGTAGAARAAAGGDPRFQLVQAPPLPPGWAGKVHAMHAGAQATAGDWLLFCDADMLMAPELLARALATARQHQLDFVTSAHTQLRPSLAWRTLMPVGAVLVTASAAPDGRGRYALGSGALLLVQRAALEAIGGWPSLRGSVGDDVDLATRLRDGGFRVGAAHAAPLIRTGSLSGAAELLGSFRKSFYGSALLDTPQLLLAGAWLLAFGTLPIGLTALGLRRRDRHLTALALAAWGLQGLGRRPFDRAVGVPPAYALSAPLAWAAYSAVLLDAGLRRLTGRPAHWKGRDRPG